MFITVTEQAGWSLTFLWGVIGVRRWLSSQWSFVDFRLLGDECMEMFPNAATTPLWLKQISKLSTTTKHQSYRREKPTLFTPVTTVSKEAKPCQFPVKDLHRNPMPALTQGSQTHTGGYHDFVNAVICGTDVSGDLWFTVVTSSISRCTQNAMRKLGWIVFDPVDFEP